METLECTTVYVLTRAELRRLAAYRAAVRAGFYNEGMRPSRRQRITRRWGPNEALLAGFDENQRVLLIALRDALKSGLYGRRDELLRDDKTFLPNCLRWYFAN